MLSRTTDGIELQQQQQQQQQQQVFDPGSLLETSGPQRLPSGGPAAAHGGSPQAGFSPRSSSPAPAPRGAEIRLLSVASASPTRAGPVWQRITMLARRSESKLVEAPAAPEASGGESSQVPLPSSHLTHHPWVRCSPLADSAGLLIFWGDRPTWLTNILESKRSSPGCSWCRVPQHMAAAKWCMQRRPGTRDGMPLGAFPVTMIAAPRLRELPQSTRLARWQGSASPPRPAGAPPRPPPPRPLCTAPHPCSPVHPSACRRRRETSRRQCQSDRRLLRAVRGYRWRECCAAQHRSTWAWAAAGPSTASRSPQRPWWCTCTAPCPPSQGVSATGLLIGPVRSSFLSSNRNAIAVNVTRRMLSGKRSVATAEVVEVGRPVRADRSGAVRGACSDSPGLRGGGGVRAVPGHCGVSCVLGVRRGSAVRRHARLPAARPHPQRRASATVPALSQPHLSAPPASWNTDVHPVPHSTFLRSWYACLVGDGLPGGWHTAYLVIMCFVCKTSPGPAAPLY